MTKRGPADEHINADQLATMIGRACRERRKELGLTQAAVATSIGITWEFYSRIERGRALPSIPKLAALANTLDLSVDHMIGRKSAQPDQLPATQSTIRLIQRASPDTLKVVNVLLRELETIMQLRGEARAQPKENDDSNQGSGQPK